MMNPEDELGQFIPLLTAAGTINGLRIVTKNILAILLDSRSTIDCHNQYLVVPLEKEFLVRAGDTVQVTFTYTAGDPLSSFRPLVSV